MRSPTSSIRSESSARAASPAQRCRRKFLRAFPAGFRDPTYLDWERDYKVEAHRRWNEALPESEFRGLLRAGEFGEVAARAVRVEQRSSRPRAHAPSPKASTLSCTAWHRFLNDSRPGSMRSTRSRVSRRAC